MSATGILFLIITLLICFGGFVISIFFSLKTSIEKSEGEEHNNSE